MIFLFPWNTKWVSTQRVRYIPCLLKLNVSFVWETHQKSLMKCHYSLKWPISNHSTGIKPYKIYILYLRAIYWTKVVFKNRNDWRNGLTISLHLWKNTCTACSTWTPAVERTLSVFCCHLSSRVSKSSNHAPVGSRSPWWHSSVNLIIAGPLLLNDLSLFLLSLSLCASFYSCTLKQVPPNK